MTDDKEARLKLLMGDLLFTIREYSDKHEKPDEILFVLDRIVAAYRTAFEHNEQLRTRDRDAKIH